MDLLSDILAKMKLAGTLYFRTAFSPPWGIQVPAFENVSRFHFVHRGRCHVHVDGVPEPISLEQGDLIIITRGAGHILSDPVNAEIMSIDDVVAAAGFTGVGALVHGEVKTGFEAQLVCGHFAFEPEATHPLMDSLPACIRIRNDGDASYNWLETTLKLIGSEAGRGQLGGEMITLRLSEIILAQAIRSFMAKTTPDDQVFAGFNDSNIRRSLEALHAVPETSWSIESLAHEAGLSRTSFANRFHSLMGMTPLSYLTNWRMQVARELLVETGKPMIDVAEASGYKSEAAFGRVFKKHFASSPAGYRRLRQG